jgi:phosphonate transport system substrate-binding protein
MIQTDSAPSGSWRQGGSCLAVAALLASGPALAQGKATDSGPFEVQTGGSFSAIAAQVLGSPRNWSRLYHPQRTGLADPNLVLVGQRFELVAEPGGHRYLRLVGSKPLPLAATAPAPQPAPGPAAPDALVIGVLPNIATAALLAQYENMKAWFERTQGTMVRIRVPANFKVFFDNTMRDDYDLSVAAPHFARVAQADRGMVPVVMYEPRINALFIGRPDDGISGAADVRGKAVGFANPTSLVALYGLQWLRQAGLEPGQDFQVRGARTDMGVGRMLLAGEAAGAIMSNGEFRALPRDEAGRLRTVEAFARIPNFIIVAHPRLGATRIDRLKTQFKAFIADKDEGAAFTKATGITGMVDADDAVLRELDPYLAPTRRAMDITN